MPAKDGLQSAEAAATYERAGEGILYAIISSSEPYTFQALKKTPFTTPDTTQVEAYTDRPWRCPFFQSFGILRLSRSDSRKQGSPSDEVEIKFDLCDLDSESVEALADVGCDSGSTVTFEKPTPSRKTKRRKHPLDSSRRGSLGRKTVTSQQLPAAFTASLGAPPGRLGGLWTSTPTQLRPEHRKPKRRHPAGRSRTPPVFETSVEATLYSRKRSEPISKVPAEHSDAEDQPTSDALDDGSDDVYEPSKRDVRYRIRSRDADRKDRWRVHHNPTDSDDDQTGLPTSRNSRSTRSEKYGGGHRRRSTRTSPRSTISDLLDTEAEESEDESKDNTPTFSGGSQASESTPQLGSRRPDPATAAMRRSRIQAETADKDQLASLLSFPIHGITGHGRRHVLSRPSPRSRAVHVRARPAPSKASSATQRCPKIRPHPNGGSSAFDNCWDGGEASQSEHDTDDESDFDPEPSNPFPEHAVHIRLSERQKMWAERKVTDGARGPDNGIRTVVATQTVAANDSTWTMSASPETSGSDEDTIRVSHC